MKIGILVQARVGSTRLAKKILLPFYQDKTLLDVIIDKLKPLNYPIILATTDLQEDLVLKKIAENHAISFFAGEEKNVLKRFIDAAEKNDIDVIIRICADNPFLHADYIHLFIREYMRDKCSYTSFFTKDHLPVIKTHYGFFSELVTLDALKKAASLTNDVLYLEHVTNFIYSHPEHFQISKIQFPFTEPNNKIRLTIDTKEDFENAAILYEKYGELNPEQLVDHVLKDASLLKKMEEQIVINSK